MWNVDSRTLAISLSVGGLVAGIVYLWYQKQRTLVKEVDEGFLDEKECGEPLPKKVIVVGLDNAGKSCLLSALSSEDNFSTDTEPTKEFNVVAISNKHKADLQLWEITSCCVVGGAKEMRKNWCNFLQDTDILVYVIDSSDRKRFPDCYTEMHQLLGDERLKDKPILVVSNKQDSPSAASVLQIREALGLEDVKHHRVQIVETSIRPPPHSIVGVSQVLEFIVNNL
ncbi:hypothetical protein EB796_019207 [Bugula neritina]|uniref:ADP-ribosylation factor-like protein 3 n=1 Tax=Bugula neritina TaxID=10212 RepID=A0A7J7J8X7_BUGNE|nr:hypothetical protein EB796_019207 [Bugula neritina]